MTVTLGVLGCWALIAGDRASLLVLGGILFLFFRMIVLAADPARRLEPHPRGEDGVEILRRDALSPASGESAIPPGTGAMESGQSPRGSDPVQVD